MILRCEITGNECGTDTWAIGKPCKCAPCREYVAASADTRWLERTLRQTHLQSVEIVDGGDGLTESQRTANRHALTGVVGP